MNRRDFLRSTSMANLSSALLFESLNFPSSNNVIAETSFGKIRGIESRGIKIFKGIPYGADTSGANRFMPPVDPTPWTGIHDALEYGHSAPQSVSSAPKLSPTFFRVSQPSPSPSIFRALNVPGEKNNGEGEDCLVLNVWTPALNDGGQRPVMLWLHGGGFRGGSGSNPGWDGTNLALRGDVVTVTINHRLSACGFANFSEFHPDFAASGQVGMLDIVHALKWVRDNIFQFGGDPNCVMIFGQSGGGRKCETLLAMPCAKGLFHRAAIQSGIAIKIVDKENAVRNAEILLRKLGIALANVHQIQQLPIDQILRAAAEVSRDLGDVDQDTLGFAPTMDGIVIPQHPFHPGASPISADVPTIIGHTRTEFTGLTTDAALWQLDEAGMRAEVIKLLGVQTEEMIDLYKWHNPSATPSDLFFLIASDYKYGAPSMKVAERRAALGKGPAYAYYFPWESPVQDGQLKSPHNIEWPFAFDNTELCAKLTGGGPRAAALADKVSDAWIAFARTGNPNTPKLPHWPQFSCEGRSTMIFDDTSQVVDDPLKEQRIAIFQALNLDR